MFTYRDIVPIDQQTSICCAFKQFMSVCKNAFLVFFACRGDHNLNSVNGLTNEILCHSKTLQPCNVRSASFLKAQNFVWIFASYFYFVANLHVPILCFILYVCTLICFYCEWLLVLLLLQANEKFTTNNTILSNYSIWCLDLNYILPSKYVSRLHSVVLLIYIAKTNRTIQRTHADLELLWSEILNWFDVDGKYSIRFSVLLLLLAIFIFAFHFMVSHFIISEIISNRRHRERRR